MVFRQSGPERRPKLLQSAAHGSDEVRLVAHLWCGREWNLVRTRSGFKLVSSGGPNTPAAPRPMAVTKADWSPTCVRRIGDDQIGLIWDTAVTAP